MGMHNSSGNLNADTVRVDTQTLFITKAIALAEKEDWPELAQNLTNLLAWIKEQIRLTQNFLGHDLREGLYNEEDDDDDDF